MAEKFTMAHIDAAMRQMPKQTKVTTPRGVYIAIGDVSPEDLARFVEKLGDPGGHCYITPIPFVQMWQLENAWKDGLPRKLKKAARGFVPRRLRQRIERQMRAGA